MVIKQRFVINLWAGISICLLLIAIWFKVQSKTSSNSFLLSAAEKIERVIASANEDFLKVTNAYSNKLPNEKFSWSEFHSLNQAGSLKFPLYVFKFDSLVYWNANHVSFAEHVQIQEDGYYFKSLANGYYVIFSKTVGNYRFFQYIPIKYVSQFESRFLNDNFLINFIGSHLIRVSQSLNAGIWVKAPDSTNLFRVSLIKTDTQVRLVEYEEWASVAWLLALLFGLVFIFLEIAQKFNASKPYLSFVYVTVITFLVRFFLFFGGNWFGLNTLKLFDPKLFAVSDFDPSLGDLFLHILTFFVPIYWVYTHIGDYLVQIKKNSKVVYFILFLVIIINAFLYLSISITKDLIINSNIDFSITSFFRLDYFSYVALLVILLMAYISFCLLFILFRLNEFFTFSTIIVAHFASHILFVVYHFSNHYPFNWLFLLVFLWPLGFYYWLRLYTIVKFNRLITIWFFYFSVLFGLQIGLAENTKELERATLTARKVYAPNDPLAEFLLFDAISSMQQDASLVRSIRLGVSDSLVVKRLRMQHFSGYLERYSVFDYNLQKGEHRIVFSDSNSEEKVFDDLVKAETFENRLGYLLKIPIKITANRTDTLNLSLVQKAFKPLSPLPNLFVEGDVFSDNSNFDFSYAVFENNKLTQQSGRFAYTSNLNVLFPNAINEYQYFKKEGFNHILFSPKKNVQVVVSYLSNSLLNKLSHISTIYLLFLVVLVIYFIIKWLVKRDFKISNLYFKTRIELALIGSVIFVLVLLGYITISYTVYKNRVNQEQEILKRILNVATKVQSSFGSLKSKNGLSDAQISELGQLATNNLTDLNLFDKNGRLIFSTQNKIFERGVLNILMPPTAFNELSIRTKTVFINNESIGTLSYLSSYVPLKDMNYELLAFINLPSFSTEAQLESDLNAFLGNLINIYVFVLILIGFTAFWLSDRITRPLQWLTKLIAETELGIRNPQMAYRTKDEVGIMLASYYRMVEQLDKNAASLAKSEKEVAWREMARQVAHEIRNPLTPIKLSVQHLMRAWGEKSDKIDGLMERVPKTILDQIESLNRIASEFSAFAQMPVGNKTVFDLKKVVSDTVNLYVDSVNVSFSSDLQNEETMIFADEEQLPRVFNNLIKNASQSADKALDLVILVLIACKDDRIIVEVRDNGNGIPKEIQSKIFVPNFTTKGSGMGLGLAIVKKIIEMNDGEIWFDSSPGIGTSFFVSFPKYKAIDVG